MPVHADGDESLRYRMDHYPPRLVVSPGAEARATAIGFEVLNERDMRQVAAAVEDAGIKVTEGSDDEADEPTWRSMALGRRSDIQFHRPSPKTPWRTIAAKKAPLSAAGPVGHRDALCNGMP